MLFKLKVTKGANAGQEIIIDKDKFLIGRADDCNLRPHSDAISRRHCVIINSAKGVGVRDLKSRNGTVVNGKKITGDKRLRNGDLLEVGPLSFEVVLEKTPAESTVKESARKESARKESANKTPATKAAGQADGAIGGMVSQWLEEADDVAREEQRLGTPETREYRFDETSRIELDQATVEEAEKSKKKKRSPEEEKDAKRKQKKKDKELGKLPKFEVKKDTPKDTQEAAQQVLRKLFNRN